MAGGASTTRNIDEVAAELQDAGFNPARNHASLTVLADRLNPDELILDAMWGRRWFPDTMSAFGAWLIVSTDHVIAMAISSGGWFSNPSSRAEARIPYSDIREVRAEYTSGQGQWQGMRANNLTIRTMSGSEHLNVPIDWTTDERFRAFVGGLRERCRPKSAPQTGANQRSFAAELKLLIDLRATDQLTDEEVAQAIRKLMAT